MARFRNRRRGRESKTRSFFSRTAGKLRRCVRPRVAGQRHPYPKTRRKTRRDSRTSKRQRDGERPARYRPWSRRSFPHLRLRQSRWHVFIKGGKVGGGGEVAEADDGVVVVGVEQIDGEVGASVMILKLADLNYSYGAHVNFMVPFCGYEADDNGWSSNKFLFVKENVAHSWQGPKQKVG